MNLFDHPVPNPRRLELPATVADCLRAGGVVVTGNARAARSLRLAQAATQRRLGLEAWSTPRIFDWDGWVSSIWRELLLGDSVAPLLLTPMQERAIWKRITLQQGEGRLVVSPDGMAKLAQRGYALLSAYCNHGERNRSWEYAGFGDAEAFRRWSLAFDQECRRHRWLSRSLLEPTIASAVEAQQVAVPDRILLLGFDRMLPKQTFLLDATTVAGARVVFLEDPEPSPASSRLIAANDLRDEIAACAWWVRNKLEADPDARFGIIVQDVDALRGEIARTFRRVLLPETLGIDAAPVAPPFEFSLGSSLATVPAIRAALLLLQWLTAPLLQEEVSWLLLSGFITDTATEVNSALNETAQFDAAMRRWGGLQPEISIDAWLRQVSAAKSAAGLRLRNHVKAAADARRTHGVDRRERTFPEWVDVAQDILGQTGWSRPTRPDSVEFQARKRWDRLLDDVSALSFDGTRVDYQTFVTALDRNAAETIFSPESRDAPIQIMGPLESAGQRFDAIWFLGADDSQWPASARPHPLIPLPVQRRAHMPHAAPEIDWELARGVTRRIAVAAEDLVFSYARQNEQGAARPSPLLNEIPPMRPSVQTSSALLAELGAKKVPQRRRTIELVDESRLPWPQDKAAGGYRTLKMQADCPFQAFAAVRLGAQELDRAEWGLTAQERGTLVHDVLERVWSCDTPPEWRLNAHHDLVTAIATNRLDEMLLHHIDAAMDRRTQTPDPWMQAYLLSEKSRLLRLLGQWFAVEVKRQPFTVIKTEKDLPDVAVGSLKLHLRVDRVDELPDGGRLLLDYKTSKVSAAQWTGARPDEPQLPLYAAFGKEENLRGVLFAQIRANDAKFVGQVEDATNTLDAELNGKNSLVSAPYEPRVLEEWAAALRGLADEFLQGEAAVSPKRSSITCEYCPLPSLCRVGETPIPLQDAALDEFADPAELDDQDPKQTTEADSA